MEFISENDLIFDIGANKGDLSEIFLKLKARVICVEPQLDCIKKLNEKFGENKNVIILPLGVSDRNSKLKIYASQTSSENATFSEKWRKEGRFKQEVWQETGLVNMVTLDELIKQYGVPRFCKIDVEGYEHNVIQGLSSNGIYCISFEFSYEFLNDTINCCQYLQRLGYNKFNFSIESNYDLELVEFQRYEEVIGKIKLFQDARLCGDIYAKK
ncbi:MAG: FkbM family methyltransferase [bacterium]|nr:FkbM family methyltransferase [bacterium]